MVHKGRRVCLLVLLSFPACCSMAVQWSRELDFFLIFFVLKRGRRKVDERTSDDDVLQRTGFNEN